jgi:MSHA biogenesis protein MshI
VFRFTFSTSQPGWLGCAQQGAQLAVARVEQPAFGRPAVRWVAETPWADPAAALRQLARSQPLRKLKRVLLLARGQYQCLTLDTPADVPRDEWAAAMRWQLKDSVDFPVDSAAVDVLAVPEGTSYRAQSQLIVVAAPQDKVQPLVVAAHGCRLPWTAIDIAETALRNLSALQEPEGRAQALLHCEASHSTLVVTYGGDLLATRQFDLSLAQLAAEAPASRQSALDQLGLELQRTLDGIERSFGQVSLARLLVTPMPGLDALCEHLRPLLYVPVATWDAEAALDLTDVPALTGDIAALNRHLCAIGAALREPVPPMAPPAADTPPAAAATPTPTPTPATVAAAAVATAAASAAIEPTLVDRDHAGDSDVSDDDDDRNGPATVPAELEALNFDEPGH